MPLGSCREGPHCPEWPAHALGGGTQVTLGVSLLYLKAGVVSISAVPAAPERAGCSLIQSPWAGGWGVANLLSICSYLCS